MMHDHSEKIHICVPCGYWHVALGRFNTKECPSCHKMIYTYSSRAYWIEKYGKEWEGIPADKVRHFGAEGFLRKKYPTSNYIKVKRHR